ACRTPPGDGQPPRNLPGRSGLDVLLSRLPAWINLEARVGSRPATSGRVVASENGTDKSVQPLLNGAQKNGAAKRRTVAAGAPSVEPAVKLVAVHKSYGRNQVLKGVNFAVAPGELVEVTGPSGSGKTTLLRLVHGQL